MRAALESQWPALSAIYGLQPWCVDGRGVLTAGELMAYIDQSEQWAKFKAR